MDFYIVYTLQIDYLYDSNPNNYTFSIPCHSTPPSISPQLLHELRIRIADRPWNPFRICFSSHGETFSLQPAPAFLGSVSSFNRHGADLPLHDSLLEVLNILLALITYVAYAIIEMDA